MSYCSGRWFVHTFYQKKKNSIIWQTLNCNEELQPFDIIKDNNNFVIKAQAKEQDEDSDTVCSF